MQEHDPHDHIEIAAYDSSWPDGFASERDILSRALGERAGAIEHIGSTAVPGLAAKPTLDIMVGSETLAVDVAAIRDMKALGYDYLGEYGISGRHFFRKGLPPTHHVHWVRRGSDFWAKQLVFRDYLRARRDAARAYEDLKRGLARRFHEDRASYTRAKTDFILRLQERAWRWAGAGLIVMDLEATCWEEGQAIQRMETIEVGAVKLDAEFKPVSELSFFVKPVLEPILTDFCARLTGIRQADVDAAEPFPAAVGKLSAWAGAGLFRLASWSAYDLEQIQRDCFFHGLLTPAPLERHIDLQSLYGRLKGCGRVPMSAALEREGLAREGRAHRALDDARNAAHLARLMIEPLTGARA